MTDGLITARLGGLLSLVVLASGCGSKTGLTVDLCEDAGTRACVHPCGPGTQSCERGVWSECVPEVLARSCDDACGNGVQACTPAGWGPCASEVTTRPCEVACGSGIETCRRGEWSACSSPTPVAPVLAVTVRDFRDTHPDFESGSQGNDRGIVEQTLGPDGVPVYAGDSRTTSGRDAFDQWYRDVDGVNLSAAVELALRPEDGGDPARFVFDDADFFPIDGLLFGNEGRAHNFHFTLSAATEFIYEGGETFRFRGDDDVFVFINRRLVIDLGGVHRPQSRSVDLDERREELGIEEGGRYPLHLFFAERQTSNSSFRIETTLSDPVLRCE
ncbi:MAG: fibro-slime domain-containing protein [Sandaracinaceae bacterium]